VEAGLEEVIDAGDWGTERGDLTPAGGFAVVSGFNPVANDRHHTTDRRQNRYAALSAATV
jgi:hypothetical protein